MESYLLVDEADNSYNMKQHINARQLLELSNEKIIKLFVLTRKWNKFNTPEDMKKELANELNKIKTDYYHSDQQARRFVTYTAHQINIGKMIEILCKSKFCFPSIGLTESRKRSEYIVVGISCLSGSKEIYGKTFESDNLCDALWEAVKAILT